MRTVTIIIGNSDDKLSQLRWSNFVDAVDKAIAQFKCKPQFSGGSYPDAPWQNYCWVFLLEEDHMVKASFIRQLAELRAQYEQDSVAWIDGKTIFV
jgi:hypothetical protein